MNSAIYIHFINIMVSQPSGSKYRYKRSLSVTVSVTLAERKRKSTLQSQSQTKLPYATPKPSQVILSSHNEPITVCDQAEASLEDTEPS